MIDRSRPRPVVSRNKRSDVLSSTFHPLDSGPQVDFYWALDIEVIGPHLSPPTQPGPFVRSDRTNLFLWAHLQPQPLHSLSPGIVSPASRQLQIPNSHPHGSDPPTCSAGHGQPPRRRAPGDPVATWGPGGGGGLWPLPFCHHPRRARRRHRHHCRRKSAVLRDPPSSRPEFVNTLLEQRRRRP
jgi:hypothetical protein